MLNIFKIMLIIAGMITLFLFITMLAFILITEIRDDYLSRKEEKHGKK